MSATVGAGLVQSQFDTSSPDVLKRDLARYAQSVREEFRRIPSSTAPRAAFVNAIDHGVTSNSGINATPGLMKAVIEALNTTNGTHIVYLPPGRFRLATPGGLTDGAACRFPTGYDNLVIRGAGPGLTIIEPAANTTELFLQIGAGNLVFEGITFDNSRWGLLQNQVKRSGVNKLPGGGVAGLGNQANCAIRMASGSDLTIRRCEFIEFIAAVNFMGDYQDATVDGGTYLAEDVFFDGCVWGHLLEQAEHVYVRRSYSRDTVYSTNSTGSVDPGHNFYFAHSDGNPPKRIEFTNAHADSDHSSIFKCRNAEIIHLDNISGIDVGRGVEMSNVRRCTGGNITFVMAETVATADNQRNALGVINCKDVMIDRVWVDSRGADAYGLRMNATTAGDPGEGDQEEGDALNNNNCVRNMTVVKDYAEASDKAPFHVVAQTDMILENPVFIHTGTSASSPSRAPVRLVECTRAHVRYPKHLVPGYSGGSPSDAHRLVEVDVDCDGCTVFFSDLDLDVGLAADTIDDDGTNTTIINVSKTPSVWRNYIQHGWGILTEETIALVNAFTVNPPRALTFAIDDFIRVLKANGWWDEIGYLVVPVLHTEQASLVDWIDPTRTATNVGAAWTAYTGGTAGFVGDNAADYVSLIAPNAVTGYAQDTAHQFVWCEGGTSNTDPAVGIVTGTQRVSIVPRDGAGNMLARLNGASASVTIGAVANRNGLFHTRRTTSTDIVGYKDGVLVASVADASVNIQSAVSTLFAGIPALFSNDRVLAYGLGGNSVATPSDLFDAFEDFFDAIGVTHS
jgi:hypothetical protein